MCSAAAKVQPPPGKGAQSRGMEERCKLPHLGQHCLRRKLQKLCRNCDQFRFSCTNVKYNIASMYGVAKATCQTRMVAVVLKLRCTGSLIPKLHFGKGYTISVGALGEIS